MRKINVKKIYILYLDGLSMSAILLKVDMVCVKISVHFIKMSAFIDRSIPNQFRCN